MTTSRSTSPYQRANLFSRGSLDLNADTKVWLDVSFSEVWSDFPFFPAHDLRGQGG